MAISVRMRRHSRKALRQLYNYLESNAFTHQAGGAQTITGSDQNRFNEQGNFTNGGVQVSSAGVNPAATGGVDYVVATFQIPAGFFDQAGRGVYIEAGGSFAANANAGKEAKLFFNPTAPVVGVAVSGGTLVADTGSQATNGGAWSLSGQVFKYGAGGPLGVGGSNTQIVQGLGAIAGASHQGISPIALATATESGVIWLAVTLRATTATTDISWQVMQVNATD